MAIPKAQHKSRIDHLIISEMVTPNSRVLDIGCGDGTLLELLKEKKSIDGRGMEISTKGVNLCLSKGLSVIHGDADHDLVDYPDNAFDYAILSHTIQATRRPKHILEQLLRISKKAIISFPNFAHWKIRAQILISGRMPVTTILSKEWYETENIHLCTIKDFRDTCMELEAKVEKSIAVNSYGNRIKIKLPFGLENVIGAQAVFLLEAQE